MGVGGSMLSLDDKLFYLQSISKDLNTQLLTLIALRESTNEAHRKIAYRQNLPMSVDTRSSNY
jgi:hypothetical protein